MGRRHGRRHPGRRWAGRDAWGWGAAQQRRKAEARRRTRRRQALALLLVAAVFGLGAYGAILAGLVGGR